MLQLLSLLVGIYVYLMPILVIHIMLVCIIQYMHFMIYTVCNKCCHSTLCQYIHLTSNLLIHTVLYSASGTTTAGQTGLDHSAHWDLAWLTLLARARKHYYPPTADASGR